MRNVLIETCVLIAASYTCMLAWNHIAIDFLPLYTVDFWHVIGGMFIIGAVRYRLTNKMKRDEKED